MVVNETDVHSSVLAKLVDELKGKHPRDDVLRPTDLLDIISKELEEGYSSNNISTDKQWLLKRVKEGRTY